MSKRYFLSREAKEDIWRIYEFGVSKFVENQVVKYFLMLHDCFDKIASNPYLFPSAGHIIQGYRYCVCGSDTIYYKISNQEIVEIITIIGRQDFK